MQIWVDADACPNAIKPILFKAAERCEVLCTFVANMAVALPPSKWLVRKVVPSGFDEADTYIEENVSPGDVVITSDIPLASDCIARGALVLTSKGDSTPLITSNKSLVCVTLWIKCVLAGLIQAALHRLAIKIKRPLPMRWIDC